jgi:hypothetical protein
MDTFGDSGFRKALPRLGWSLHVSQSGPASLTTRGAA